MRTLLRAKIQEIRITDANSDYEGSLTLDEDIMDRLDLVPYEQIYVNSKEGKGRIMTYVIPGDRGSECCEINGGAANHFSVGEIVHILAFFSTDIEREYIDKGFLKPIII